MKARFELHGEVGIVPLEGRLTMGSDMATLEEIFIEAGAEQGYAIIVDLGGVNFIDSAGLGELVALNRRVEKAGGRVFLVEAHGKVNDLIELTRIAQLIPVAKTLDEALALLS